MATANCWDGGEFVFGVENGCRVCQRLYERLDDDAKWCVREHLVRECGRWFVFRMSTQDDGSYAVVITFSVLSSKRGCERQSYQFPLLVRDASKSSRNVDRHSTVVDLAETNGLWPKRLSR